MYFNSATTGGPSAEEGVVTLDVTVGWYGSALPHGESSAASYPTSSPNAIETPTPPLPSSSATTTPSLTANVTNDGGGGNVTTTTTTGSRIKGDLNSYRRKVLDLISLLKLKRKQVAEQAGVPLDLFREMNYWLRGKELTREEVISMGKRLVDWYHNKKRTREKQEEESRAAALAAGLSAAKSNTSALITASSPLGSLAAALGAGGAGSHRRANNANGVFSSSQSSAASGSSSTSNGSRLKVKPVNPMAFMNPSPASAAAAAAVAAAVVANDRAKAKKKSGGSSSTSPSTNNKRKKAVDKKDVVAAKQPADGNTRKRRRRGASGEEDSAVEVNVRAVDDDDDDDDDDIENEDFGDEDERGVSGRDSRDFEDDDDDGVDRDYGDRGYDKDRDEIEGEPDDDEGNDISANTSSSSSSLRARQDSYDDDNLISVSQSSLATASSLRHPISSATAVPAIISSSTSSGVNGIQNLNAHHQSRVQPARPQGLANHQHQHLQQHYPHNPPLAYSQPSSSSSLLTHMGGGGGGFGVPRVNSTSRSGGLPPPISSSLQRPVPRESAFSLSPERPTNVGGIGGATPTATPMRLFNEELSDALSQEDLGLVTSPPYQARFAGNSGIMGAFHNVHASSTLGGEVPFPTTRNDSVTISSQNSVNSFTHTVNPSHKRQLSQTF